MPKSSRFIGSPRPRRRGFTLLQIVVVVGSISALSAVSMGVLARAGVPARRAKCDVHLKQISLALDTFRQEQGRLPKSLLELQSGNYVSQDTLICPDDATGGVHSGSATRNSYYDFYVLREPRDSKELPVLVCAWHEKDGSHGLQSFQSGYTAQFAARPAQLAATDISGVVTITRPGEGVLPLPIATKALQLHGGDRIKTGAGTATLRFQDSSTATIQANSEMSVLQSYADGQRGGPLYTLVRQFSGRCNYFVSPGNRFDVSTPTATAGALGTRFSIALVPNSPYLPSGVLETVLSVQEHTVALTTTNRTVWVKENEVAVAANDPLTQARTRIPRGSQEEKAQKNSVTTSTPVPTAIPTAVPTMAPAATPRPTAPPTDSSGNGNGGDKGDDDDKDKDDKDDKDKGNSGPGNNNDDKDD